MGVSFEKVKPGWVVRMGASHSKYGDAYTATAHIDENGFVRGLSGVVSKRLMRDAIGLAKKNLNLEPKWERIKDMYTVKIEVSSDSKGVLTTLVQNLFSKEELVAYQRAIADGIFNLGEKNK